MKARAVLFDLSFLDPSAAKVDPQYLKTQLPRYMDDGFYQIEENTGAYIDAFASGALKAEDAEEAKEAIRAANNEIRNQLKVNIEYVASDMDAYLANALKFFGDSFLTLTMVTENDISGDEKVYHMDPEILSWLEEDIALKNINAADDTRTPEQLGILPALDRLLVNAKGAGFVNAPVDADGYRRRVYLVLKHRDKYYSHLALSGMREMLGEPDIEINDSTIILKNAVLGGEIRDIRIPRAEDGSVLIKWPKKRFSEYNTMSILSLIMYPELERYMVENLDLMTRSNFFSYWDEEETPAEKYSNANYIKEILYQGEDNDQGVGFDLYLEYRQAYLDATAKWLNGGYEEKILADLADAPAVQEEVSVIFQVTRKQFQKLMELREETEKRVKDSLCVIGVDATSMTDLGLITFQERFPNVGTYGALANMILSNEFLDDAPWYISFILALVFSLTLSFIIKKLGTGQSVLVGVIAISLTIGIILLFFVLTKRYLGLVVPFTAVTFTFFTLIGFNFLSTVREKAFIRSAFSRYLAPAVIDQIIADPSKLNLGGRDLFMTAIFTDLRGFSTVSEKLSASALVELLNLYLTEMSNIILTNQGTIDKYEGDAIIAFFGAPITCEDHAIQACRSALQIKKAEIEFNLRLGERPISPEQISPRFKNVWTEGMDWRSFIGDIYTRLGINTGEMVVGNMGTPNKMDYTIMGNAVNLAARLEGVNKQYHTGGILLSEYTKEKLGDEFVLRSLDRVRVVGIDTPLRLYELLAFRADSSPELLDMSASWEKGIIAYEAKDFIEAGRLFTEILAKNSKDLTAKLYIDRCERYKNTPPPSAWDGVNNLTEK
jgi:adenylate cyclase